jgi:septal ring factor EnvC (AmiA/AmiB activator)
MVEINDINRSDDDDDDNVDSGNNNNNRGIVVGANRFPSFFARLANPSFSLTKFLSKFVLKYSFATIRFLKWKLNKYKFDIEEKNATIRYSEWRIPKVEDDLQDARKSIQDLKQSIEYKDGHIELITNQKKQHVQTMRRKKKEDKAATFEANQRELGLNGQIVELNSKWSTEMEAKANRLEVLKQLVVKFNGGMDSKVKAEIRVKELVETLEGETKLKAKANTRVEELEKEVEELEKEVETLNNKLTGADAEVKRLGFKFKQAMSEKKTLSCDHTKTAGILMGVNTDLKKSEGARNLLNEELQEANKALCVAKDGTPLEFVIKIDKNPNYKASKLQELTELVKSIYERYSEKDLLENDDDEDFPFPLNKVAKEKVYDQLVYESKIIVEIKSDPILFRTFNDLIWNKIFNDKSLTYDYFLSFIGWIGTDVFNTTKITTCKIRKLKRKRDEDSPASAPKAKKSLDPSKSPPRISDSSTTSTGDTASTTSPASATSTGDTASFTSPASTIATTSSTDDPNDAADSNEWSSMSSKRKTDALNLGFTEAGWNKYHGVSSSSLINCTKRNAKAGTTWKQDGIRYYLIRPAGDDKWDAAIVNEKTEEGTTTCQCPFCYVWKKSQGITMHITSCTQNCTEIKKKQSNNTLS